MFHQTLQTCFNLLEKLNITQGLDSTEAKLMFIRL